MTKKVAVVLSGCGFMDGAEIHESVLTLYFLERVGLAYQCFAPDKEQADVVNHLTGKADTGSKRNVLVESARIARGEIQDLAQARMDDFDALVMPGGFGVAKNLSDFASAGAGCTIDADLTALIGAAVQANKPIVAICISPAILAKALQGVGIQAKLTVGSDEDGAAAAVRACGSDHQACPVREAVVDEAHKIVSTPAYMLGPNPSAVGAGIEEAIAHLGVWLRQG